MAFKIKTQITFETILSNLGYHCSLITRDVAPISFGLSCVEGVYVKVEITKKDDQTATSVWNHVSLRLEQPDGGFKEIYSGNRAGAVTAYCKACTDAIRAAAKNEEIETR